MPSVLQARLDAFRADLLAGDRRVLGMLANAYGTVLDRLEADIVRLGTDLAEGVVTGGRAEMTRWLLARDRSLAAQVETALRVYRPGAEALIRTAQRQAALLGEAQAVGLMEAAGGVAAEFARLPASALADLVGILAPGTPLAAALDQLGPAMAATIRDGLVEALGVGQGPREAAGLIRDRLVGLGGGLTRAGVPRLGWVQQVCRTSMLNAYRSASQRSFAENKRLLRGWWWSSAHQRNTCPCCLGLDGKIFPVEETMHSHRSCRCVQVPLLSDRPAPNLPTGADWLAAQPPAVQDAVLTRAGGAAYRAGDLSLAHFVGHDDDPIFGPGYHPLSGAAALARAGVREAA
jgi:hypothetical protein